MTRDCLTVQSPTSSVKLAAFPSQGDHSTFFSDDVDIYQVDIKCTLN